MPQIACLIQTLTFFLYSDSISSQRLGFLSLCIRTQVSVRWAPTRYSTKRVYLQATQTIDFNETVNIKVNNDHNECNHYIAKSIFLMYIYGYTLPLFEDALIEIDPFYNSQACCAHSRATSESCAVCTIVIFREQELIYLIVYTTSCVVSKTRTRTKLFQDEN